MSTNSQSVVSSEVSVPSAAWGLERLAGFVREASAESGRLEIESLKMGKTILRLHFDRGKALVVIRDEVLGKKRQAWARFRKEHGFTGTTYDDDIRLYESAYSWEEIAGMGLTEARVYLGVTKPKVRQEAEPATEATPAIIPAATPSDQSQAVPILVAMDMPVGNEPDSSKIAHLAPSSATPPPPVSAPAASSPASPSPEETLFRIVRRLEELEREVQGQVVETCFPLIDQAIEVLGRLRGVTTRNDVSA